MKVYLIPGLGYDCRIFEKLDLDNFDVELINWIEPKPKESIQNYAKRLAANIEQRSEKVVLIGHSLGGIMAQEISTFLKIDKIILISSIKSRKEMPFYFKIIAPLKLYKLFTKEMSIKTVKYWGKDHGFETTEELALFKSMVGKHSNHYLQWALKSLSKWSASTVPSETSLIQIHGTYDQTFPFKLIEKADFVVENGGHFMVYKSQKLLKKLFILKLRFDFFIKIFGTFGK